MVEQDGVKGDRRNNVHAGMRNPPFSSQVEEWRRCWPGILLWSLCWKLPMRSQHIPVRAGQIQVWIFIFFYKNAFLFSFSRCLNNCPFWPRHQRQYSNWICCWRDSCMSCSHHAAAEVWIVPAGHGPLGSSEGCRLQVKHMGRHYPELEKILPQHHSHTPKVCVTVDVMNEVRLWRLPLHPMGRCSCP